MVAIIGFQLKALEKYLQTQNSLVFHKYLVIQPKREPKAVLDRGDLPTVTQIYKKCMADVERAKSQR